MTQRDSRTSSTRALYTGPVRLGTPSFVPHSSSPSSAAAAVSFLLGEEAELIIFGFPIQPEMKPRYAHPRSGEPNGFVVRRLEHT